VESERKEHIPPFTLCFDIGGTEIKMMVVAANRLPLTSYQREATPQPAEVSAVLNVITAMIQTLKHKFDRVAAGFPGVVIKGKIKTAPNMDTSWIGVDLQQEFEKITGHPALVANDADVQGFGDIRGTGVELVITLGTGMGSALFVNGKLVPNLELAHHPFKDNSTYEEFLGKKALKREGVKEWQRNLLHAISLWELTFNYDRLYIGGGYAHLIDIQLPENIQISENIEGVLGGVALWESNSYTY
jgi:polyphosphate glucokinase